MGWHWINQAQDKHKQRDIVDTVKKRRAPEKAEIFRNAWKIVSFSRILI